MSIHSFRQAAGVVSLALLVLTAANAFPSEAVEPPSVRLVIDYGDGVQTHFTNLAWREGMTVLEALAAAKTHARGVDFAQRGSGGSTMITRIGDLSNQGGRGDGKNWIYRVNDAPGDVSCGVRKLQAGDVILWKFQVYEYNP